MTAIFSSRQRAAGFVRGPVAMLARICLVACVGSTSFAAEVSVDDAMALNARLLMAAAYAGHVDAVRLLLAKGANFQAVDRLHKNAMTYAAGQGHAAIVQALLDAGVDPNEVYRNDLTALMWAAGYGQTEVARLLVAAGARADMRDNRGKTALDIAREQKFDATVSVLEAAMPAR